MSMLASNLDHLCQGHKPPKYSKNEAYNSTHKKMMKTRSHSNFALICMDHKLQMQFGLIAYMFEKINEKKKRRIFRHDKSCQKLSPAYGNKPTLIEKGDASSFGPCNQCCCFLVFSSVIKQIDLFKLLEDIPVSFFPPLAWVWILE